MNVILGLGSNLGDRPGFLRLAIAKLKGLGGPSQRFLRIQKLSPVYESAAMLPKDGQSEVGWSQSYLNMAILCETGLLPHELLAQIKDVEVQVGRKSRSRWASREIDIDILAADSMILQERGLSIPHPGLLERPFVLLPLSDVAPQWVYPVSGASEGKTASELASKWRHIPTEDVPYHTRRSNDPLPACVGIVNVTPDSFSDGGEFINPNKAIDQAMRLAAAGACVLDIGAESTRPRAVPVHPEEEWRRIEPVLDAVISQYKTLEFPPKISVDTRNPQTAKRAIAKGIHWINDVSGTAPEMQKIIADSNVDVVVMHNLGVPPDPGVTLPKGENPIDLILEWAHVVLKELEDAGIRRERIIFDPGIGFGKSAAQSFQVLREIGRLHELGVRVLVGHSRKSFLAQMSGREAKDRDLESAVVSVELARSGVDFLRVHDVEFHLRAIRAGLSLHGVVSYGSEHTSGVDS